MGFFKKEEAKEEKRAEISNINKQVTRDENASSVKRKKLSICDIDTIEYVIKNFPSMSIDIQDGLLNLSNILEKTIDHIEDQSSEVIKKNRNFELSQSYRDTSISIYKMVENIKDYVLWMKDEYEKGTEKNQTKLDTTTEALEEENNDDIKNDLKEDTNKESEYINYLENKDRVAIYNDFTGREPEAFVLKDEVVKVDDWNDLLVKIAEVLTKKYKENKNLNKTVKEFDIVEVKSNQNEFRNTVIEMLNDYKIDLDKFEIIEK